MKTKLKTEAQAEPTHGKPCASCPFLETNFEEFNAIAVKLCEKHGQPRPDFFQCLTVRDRVKDDAIKSGKLACHRSVYDKGMDVDTGKAIPCAGLALHLRGMA